MLGLHSYIERRHAGCFLLIGYDNGSFKLVAMLPYICLFLNPNTPQKSSLVTKSLVCVGLCLPCHS